MRIASPLAAYTRMLWLQGTRMLSLPAKPQLCTAKVDAAFVHTCTTFRWAQVQVSPELEAWQMLQICSCPGMTWGGRGAGWGALGPQGRVPIVTWLIPQTGGTYLYFSQAHFLTSCNLLWVFSPHPSSLWTGVSQQGVSTFQLDGGVRLLSPALVPGNTVNLQLPASTAQTQTDQLLVSEALSVQEP